MPRDIRLVVVDKSHADTLVFGKNDVFRYRGENYLGGKCLSKQIFDIIKDEVIKDEVIKDCFPLLEECE